jgi:hypothetical protein
MFKKGHKTWNKGKSLSEETKRKMSLVRKGKPRSEEWKRNISNALKGEKSPMWGTHRSEEIRRKISNSTKGEKSWCWKGGITEENHKVRSSLEYRLWRTAVFERDNYTCVWCGRKKEVSGKLNADHIKPFALYPELRFAIDNGRTLCESCHRTTDTWGTNKRYIIR